jgi:hypothetical protein
VGGTFKAEGRTIWVCSLAAGDATFGCFLGGLDSQSVLGAALRLEVRLIVNSVGGSVKAGVRRLG